MQAKDKQPSAALVKRMVKEYREGATLTMLSVNHKLGLSKVRQVLVDAGVEIRKKGSSRFDSNRAEEMSKLYEDGETLQQIGERYSLSRERVRQILRSAGIESLGRREKSGSDSALTATERKIAKAYDNGQKPSEIMKAHGITYVAFRSILKRAGVATKPKGFFNRRPGYEKIRKGVIKDYQAGVDTGVIAERYGLCGRTEIYKFIKREGIEPRQRQDGD